MVHISNRQGSRVQISSGAPTKKSSQPTVRMKLSCLHCESDRARENLGNYRPILALQHLVDSILPSRPSTHLFQRILLRLLLIHPASLHRRGNHVFIQLLKRQKLPLHISTVNAIWIVEILSPMLLSRSQRPTTTLTLHRKRHGLTQKPTITETLDNHTWTHQPPSAVTKARSSLLNH